MNGFLGFLICCMAAVATISSRNIALGVIAFFFMFISFYTWGLNLRLSKGRDVKALRRTRARMLLENRTQEEIRKALKEQISTVDASTAPVPRWVRILNFISVVVGIIILATAMIKRF